jgi:hypothetical protein
MGQTQEGRRGIDLPLPLPDLLGCELPLPAKVHWDPHDQRLADIIKVGRPVGLGGLEPLERVGVAIHHEELSLRVEQPPGQCGDMGAILVHSDVGDELVGGIPEPHGFDIARDDIGGFVALGEVVVLHSGAHGIGKGLDQDIEEGGSHLVLVGRYVFVDAGNGVVELVAEGDGEQQQ